MLSVGVAAPWIMWKNLPTEQEVFEKYSPELKKKSLEGRQERAQQVEDFVTKLKRHAKDDRNIWIVMQEAQEAEKKEQQRQLRMSMQARDQRMRDIRTEAGVASN